MRTPEERKAENEHFLRARGIGVFEGLPLLPPADAVRRKGVDEICRRAIAALLSTQIACDIGQEEYGNVAFYIRQMEKFGVRDVLNAKEQRLVNGMFEQQDVVDVVWEYECYWALVWALGLIGDIRDASKICDCGQAVHLVRDCGSYDDFKSACRPRDVEEVLDMLDLFYRCHWACRQKAWVDPKLPIGDLNAEVVFERRRGLEWLISPKRDWYEISLDT